MTTKQTLQSAVDFPVALWIKPPISPFQYQGCSNGTFELHLYSKDSANHHVDLYAQSSDSIPWQEPQNKWSHLNPQWRFTDLSGNKIDYILLNNAVSTTYNGTTGYMSSGEFLFIDDMPSHACDTRMLWAVVDYSDYPVWYDNASNRPSLSGFANSKVMALYPYLVNSLIPTNLDVTRDGLNPMFDFYWKNSSIPHIISVAGESKYSNCSAIMMKNTPTTNLNGILGGLITRELSGVSDTSVTWTPDNSSVYLSAFDSQEFNIGGYVRSSLITDTEAANTVISTSGTVYYEDIPIHFPYLWISNPENNTISRVYAPCIKEELKTIDLTPWIYEIGQEVFNTSYLQVTSLTDSMSLTGFHGVYGIAVDGEDKHVWCADAESDRVYKFDAVGTLLSSINFGEDNTFDFGVTGGCTPAGISVDGVSGVWVTFFDSASVVCLDKNTGEVKDIIPTNAYTVSAYENPICQPVLAEPDIDSNLWISYNNTVSSSLVKYDTTTKSILTSITLPLCSNPTDLYITQDNDVWVTLSHQAGPPYGLSTVNKYKGTADYDLLSSLSATNPSYLALDREENIWFTEMNNTLTRVTTAGIYTSWTVGPSNTYTTAPTGIYDSALEGLCCDLNNAIWILNSVNNTLYTIDIKDEVHYVLKVLPDENKSWYNNDGIFSLVDENNKSIQALGDWSGSKWILKYGNTEPVTTSAFLSGSSNKFDIYDFNGFDIRRFNESWDASNKVKSFAIAPHIAENPVLWDDYMNAAWGDASSPQGEGFGREAYERIANFVPNHSDINTCNVEQLYNLADFTDVPIDIYGIELPPDIRRIMDIGSINQQQLWGARCGCKQNITTEYKTALSGFDTIEIEGLCERCGHYHPGNRGGLFDPTTYMVTAFEPFIVEDRTNTINKYKLLTPPLSCNVIPTVDVIGDVCVVSAISSDCISTYPLSSYYHIILPEVFDFGVSANVDDFQEAITYFCFYDYVDSSCDEQIAGVINWDDAYTTLDEHISSVEDWYGNGQTLEKIINYTLHKGLGLIEG